MTTNNKMPSAAPRGSTVDVIDTVDAFSRRLYRRARNAGGDFSDVAAVVRGLHTVLKHLKVEAEDPDSLLNTDQSPVYVRQLTPIVEDCEFTLKQLDTILEKYGASNSGSDEEGRNHLKEKHLEDREYNMIALIRTKLANQKLNIDMFLDTVQLHNPSKSHQIVDPNNANLDCIKDKVDVIADRIFQRRNSNATDAEEEMWRQFRDELVDDGFSGEVLGKHQDVLRAYIRQLDEQRTAGKTPTVRGFLEEYQPRDDPYQVTPYPDYPAYAPGTEDISPKEMVYHSMDNEKFFPSMKMARLQPDKHEDSPYPSSLPTSHSTGLSYDRHYSEDDDYEDGSTALISTRDLMAIDKRQADLAIAMGNMHLQPHGPSYTHSGGNSGTSPQTQYLPAPSNAGLLTGSSPNLTQVEQYGLSPRFVPPIPPPPYGSSPPPVLHHNSISAPVISGGAPAQPTGAQRYARLAPDSQGKDIPLDARWTRIRRSLVSPEVLNQVGVRYEARPDFVAILGVLSKKQIEEFARQSAEARRRRGDQRRREQRDEKDRYNPEKYKPWDVEAQRTSATDRYRGANGNISSSSELYDSSDSTETDEEQLPSYRPCSTGNDYHPQDEKQQRRDDKDDHKGTKVYPFIVSPPEKEKELGASPSATVKPKPILKNKNDDHRVRFDPEPQVLDGTSPRSVPRRGGDRDRREDRDKRHRGSDRDRHVPRSYDERSESHRDWDRDRDRDRDDEYRRRHGRHHHGEGSSSNGGRRGDRDRGDEYSRRRRKDERDRTTDRSEDRSARKKARGETLRAVGIGGAAASLLSVLTEAAAGL